MPAVSERITGASVCFVSPDDRILFLHRADGKGWDIPGGHREAGETAEQNALREAREETGGLPYGELALLDRQDGDGVDWTVFRMPVRYAFTPKLSDEHDGSQWSAFGDRPRGMMHETAASLSRGFDQAHDEFVEEDHPRAENGRFGTKSGGSSSGKEDPSKSQETVDLYHGSHEHISEINGSKGSYGGLFASGREDAARSHGNVLHRIRIPVSQVMTQHDMEYEADPKKVRKVLKSNLKIKNEDDFDIAYAAVVEDKGTGDFDSEDISRIFGTPEDEPWEAEIEAQRIRGAIAQSLGYKAVEMRDEHGTSHLVLPGNTIEEMREGNDNAVDSVATRASDCLAFDRASVRTIDKDGRLHVALTHISKANVCPYRGDEIPDPDGALNLDPDRIYMLLRDPEELEKGAPTSNGIQVMSEHIGVSADEPQKMLIAGATGNDARFNAPYLDNSLVVWDADLLRGIEDGSQQQISCSYYYRADMTAGRYEGVSYDGIMRDIVFNHVAIVPVGRAGPDVLVGDSLSSLTGVTTMGKSLSKKAAMAKGALLAILKPKKLAADKALDLDKVLAGVTTKNWLSKKPGIIAAIKPSLAKDADLDDVVQLIDALDKEQPEESDPGEITVDEDPRIEKILSLIRGKVSDEDLQAVTEALKESAAEDEDKEERRKREEEERKTAQAANAAADEPDQTTGAATAHPGGKPEDEKVSKSAMDAAIATERARSAKALREVEAKTIERLRSIASAEEDVHPYVGKLAVAMDSAEDVYKTALETMGVDVAGIHPSAYRAVLMAHPKPGATQKRVANDASMTSSITDAFPNAARLR